MIAIRSNTHPPSPVAPHHQSPRHHGPLCACGCGAELRADKTGQFPRFRPGHNAKLDKLRGAFDWSAKGRQR